MQLGDMIKKWRVMQERTLRAVAVEMGISASTLMRFENGEGCDSDTFAKILGWCLRPRK